MLKEAILEIVKEMKNTFFRPKAMKSRPMQETESKSPKPVAIAELKMSPGIYLR